jgi:hypothetical protein
MPSVWSFTQSQGTSTKLLGKKKWLAQAKDGNVGLYQV